MATSNDRIMSFFCDDCVTASGSIGFQFDRQNPRVSLCLDHSIINLAENDKPRWTRKPGSLLRVENALRSH
ncbi:MAG: hypothetical protein ACKV0T_24880 [Planctomycetales bacterium]